MGCKRLFGHVDQRQAKPGQPRQKALTAAPSESADQRVSCTAADQVLCEARTDLLNRLLELDGVDLRGWLIYSEVAVLVARMRCEEVRLKERHCQIGRCSVTQEKIGMQAGVASALFV